MENNEREQFVEDLLDASLARHSAVVPRRGLEARIVATAKAAQAQRRWFVWGAWVAAGAAAALVVLGVFSHTRRVEIPAPPPPVAVVKAPTESRLIPGTGTSSGPGVHAVHKEPKRQSARTVAALARNESRPAVFPSPSPATEQEKLIAQLVRTSSPEILPAATTDVSAIPELEIKPLNITPIDTDESQGKNN